MSMWEEKFSFKNIWCSKVHFDPANKLLSPDWSFSLSHYFTLANSHNLRLNLFGLNKISCFSNSISIFKKEDFLSVKTLYEAIGCIFSCPKQLNRWPCHSLTHWLTHWLTDWQYFYFWHTKSAPRDLWPLRHLIRVMRRHDLTIFWQLWTFFGIFGTFLALFPHPEGPLAGKWTSNSSSRRNEKTALAVARSCPGDHKWDFEHHDTTL